MKQYDKAERKMDREFSRQAEQNIEKMIRKRDSILRQRESWINIVRKAAAAPLMRGIFCLNLGILLFQFWFVCQPSGMMEVSAADNTWNAESRGPQLKSVSTPDMEGSILLAEAESEPVTEGSYQESEPGNEGLYEEGAANQFIDGWVQDDAGLLTAEEEEALETECGRLFQVHDTSVYIITTPDFGGGDIKDWQRQIFSQYNLGEDSGGSGVMLAISMAERDWGLVGFGAAQEAFSTYARERLGSLILDDLSDGEFYEAFSGYLSIADDCLLAAEKGEPYTEQHRYREGWRFPMIFGVSFLLSLGVSAAVVMSWRKGMNTRVRQNGAMEYLKAGSFYLSNQSDLFLYHTVSRTQRPKNDSSSGGSMHSDSSGTSGKF